MLYAPNETDFKALMAAAFPNEPPKVFGFHNTLDLLQTYRKITPAPRIGPEQRVVAINFIKAESSSPHNLYIKMGFYDDLRFLSKRLKGYAVFSPLPDAMTQRSSFAYTQLALTHAHLQQVQRKTNNSDPAYNISVQRLPDGPYPTEAVSRRSLMALRIGLGFVVPFCVLVGQLVEETQNGMREKLRVVGLNDAVYWLGHFLAAMVTGAFSSSFVMIYMTVWGNEKHGVTQTFLDGTSKAVVVVSFLLFCIQYITKAMLLSVFFTNSTMAVLVALCYWLTSYAVPWLFLEDFSGRSAHYILLGRWTKLFTAMMPCMGIHWCFRIIGCANLVGRHPGFILYAPYLLLPEAK